MHFCGRWLVSTRRDLAAVGGGHQQGEAEERAGAQWVQGVLPGAQRAGGGSHEGGQSGHSKDTEDRCARGGAYGTPRQGRYDQADEIVLLVAKIRYRHQRV